MQFASTIRLVAFACVAFSAAPSSAASLLEAIFGGGQARPAAANRDFLPPTPPASIGSRPTPALTPAIGTAPTAAPKKAQASGRRSGGGGSLAVCVRTCDGFFFPVNYEGARGADRYTEACQASCPGAETEVYFKPQGADMHAAANGHGRNYTQLPNAFKYRQGLESSCSCKGANETWAQALKGAADLIGTHKNDIVVTEETSAQSVLPAKAAAPATAGRAKDKLAAVEGLTPKAQ